MKLAMRWLLILLGLTIVIFSSGCSGARNLDIIYAYSLFSHKQLVLPIKAKNAEIGAFASYGYITFESKKNLQELYDSLEKNTNLDLQKNDQAILIRQNNGTYTDHYCLRYGKESRYVFSGMRGRLITDIDSYGNKIQSAILLPVHLISDSLIIETASPYSLYVDVEYEICGNMVDIESFYRESGWYNLTCEENVLILSGYRNPQDVFIDSTTSSATEQGSLEINCSFCIQVSTHDGKSFFSISLI